MSKPIDRLPPDENRQGHEDRRIDQRGEDLETSEPIREAPGGRLAPKGARRDRQQESGYVARVVEGIGQESEAPAREPSNDLHRRDEDVEADAQPESRVE